MKTKFKRLGTVLVAVAMLISTLPSAVLARVGTITKEDVAIGDYTITNVQPYQNYLYVTTNEIGKKGVKILRENAQGGYTDITPETVSVDVPLEGEALAEAIVAGDLKGQVRSADHYDTIAIHNDILAVAFDWTAEANFDNSVYHSTPKDENYQVWANGQGVRLYSLENPEMPQYLGVCYSNYTRGIAFNGDYLYVANESDELQIMDTRTVSPVSMYLSNYLPNSGLKAYALRTLNDKLYIGAYAGDNIYSITDAALLVFDISEGNEQAPKLLVNRKYTRADGAGPFIRSLAVSEKVVAVIDAPEGGRPVEVSLFANDINTLETAQPLSVITKTAEFNWNLEGGWTRYAKIFNDDYLFVTCAGASHFNIYDISDPTNPQGKFFSHDGITFSCTLTSQGNKVYSGNENAGKKGSIVVFTIDSPDVFANDMEFTSNGIVLNQPVAGKIESSIRLTNNTSASKDVKLIAAYYEDGKLSAVKTENETLPGGATREISTTITASELSEDCYVKYMLWDDVLTPLDSARVYGAPAYVYNDLFDEYINSVPTLDTLCAQVGQPTTEVIDGIEITRFRFNSVEVDGYPNRVYCVLAKPAGASAENKVPAILQIHGGGGSAKDTESAIIENAKQGYASLTFDCPAWCAMTEVTKEQYDAYVQARPEMGDRYELDGKYYVGNDTNVGRWLTESSNPAYGAYAVTDGSVEKNSTYGTVVAGLQAFNYLASLDYVDETKMGITGISMGGYLTTMLTSLLGDKVVAAYSIYGCGYYEKGSSFIGDVLNPSYNADYQTWLDNLDAGRYAYRMTAPYFVAGAINDYFFYPEAVMATLNDIPNKNQAFSANSMHNLWQLPNWDKYAQEIFKYYLKGEGNKMPVVTVESAEKLADGSLEITFTPVADGDLEIASTLMYYSPISGKLGQDGKINTERQWTSVTPTAKGDGTYTVSVPAATVAEGAEWTVIATDNRFGDNGMTGGTYVYNTKYEF